LLAGCGDKALAQDAYVRRGNAICDASRQRFNALFETDFPVVRSDVPAFFKRGVAVVRAQMTKLRDLHAPSPNHGEVKRFLKVGDRAVADYERGTRDEAFGAEIFTQNGGKNAQAFGEQAAAYGLTKCKEEDQSGPPKLDPATFSPEKRAYVTQADAICKRSIDQQKPLEDKYLATFPPTMDAWSGFIPQALPLERAKLADLRRLNPPAADKATIEGIWNKNQALNDKIEAAGRAAATKDENTLRSALKPVFSGFDEVEGAERQYGFQVCGPTN
jgi:hypothetical protein